MKIYESEIGKIRAPPQRKGQHFQAEYLYEKEEKSNFWNK
jgi:hypothetical protein